MLTKLVISCMLLLSISVAVCAENPDPNNWYWNIIAGALPQDLGFTVGKFGVAPGANDGYGSQGEDGQITLGSNKAYCGTYHVIGSDGWTGGTGFYCKDIRAPLVMQPGTSKTWTIYVWADSSLPARASAIELYCEHPYSLPDNLAFTLTLRSKPASVTAGPAVGTVWNLSSGVQLFLPVFRTANGLEGYVFDFTATVVPEPGSLAALALGLIPLAFRRRRK